MKRFIWITSDIVNGLKMWSGPFAPMWLAGEAKWLPVLGQCRSVCRLDPDHFPEITDDLQHGKCVRVNFEVINRY